jgi:hypothetical protein
MAMATATAMALAMAMAMTKAMAMVTATATTEMQKSVLLLLALMSVVVDMLEVIVIRLLLACGSGVKIFFRFFCYMHRKCFFWQCRVEQKYKRSALSSVPMFLVVFIPDVLVELLKQDLHTLLGTRSTIVPCVDVLLYYFKSCTAQDKSKSSVGWISS